MFIKTRAHLTELQIDVFQIDYLNFQLACKKTNGQHKYGQSYTLGAQD